jgi:hypothetical protein
VGEHDRVVVHVHDPGGSSRRYSIITVSFDQILGGG